MHKNIVLIGSGRFGQSVGYLFEHAGARIVLRTTRSNAPQVIKFNSQPETVLYDSTKQQDLTQLSADLEAFDDLLVIIAVHDDALKQVAAQITELRLSWKDCSVIHASASADEKILKPFGERGARTGALHLTCPINHPVEKFFPGSAFTFAGDSSLSTEFESVITNAGYQFINLTDINRTLYHAGCVMAAGHVAALMTVAGEILASSGVEDQAIRKILFSLLSAQADGLAKLDTDQDISALLTGPFVRRDKETTERQMATLREISPKFLMLYDLLGNLTTALATSRTTLSTTRSSIQ